MSNKKLFVLLVIDLTLLIYLFVFWKAEAMVQEVPATCPAGSYEIGRKELDGEPICKLEPTGCPYGDSIPMDMCDKFAPKPEVVEPDKEVTEVKEPVATQLYKECGK